MSVSKYFWMKNFAFSLVLALLLSSCSGGSNAMSALPQPYAGVSARADHTCAQTAVGAIKCWGGNANGELGNGTTTGSNVPVNVNGLSSGIRSFSTGVGHACALNAGGGVLCWGLNDSGQLGDGSQTNRAAPVNASALSGISRGITAGRAHSCALTAPGGVVCWGAGEAGQLGNGQDKSSLQPVAVSGLSAAVAGLSAGWDFTCALTAAGGVLCWGDNRYGQLGNGSTTSSSSPVTVSGLTPGTRAISAGVDHACALTSVGGVVCWGRNQDGQLGDGTTTDSATPRPVNGLGSGVKFISAGGDLDASHTCALTISGSVKCWGSNQSGQLGNGGGANSSSPVDVSGLSMGARAIAAGGSHSCAINATAELVCWGDNRSGQLGNGSSSNSSTPVSVR